MHELNSTVFILLLTCHNFCGELLEDFDKIWENSKWLPSEAPVIPPSQNPKSFNARFYVVRPGDTLASQVVI
jgi:hypothetical protein